MSDERSWVSPYSYCQNMPINRIDPDGALDDDYLIRKTGEIIFKKTDDAFDRFYVETDQKTENSTTIRTYSLVAQLDKNKNGLVNFPESGSSFGRYTKKDAGGDHYLKPTAAAALFGLISDMRGSYNVFNIDFGDMSDEDGKAPGGDHKTHGGPNGYSGVCVDYRYLDDNNTSFQGTVNNSKFSPIKNVIFLNHAKKWGLTKNYISNKSVWKLNNLNIIGINGKKIGGHNDHGHLTFIKK